MVKFASCHHTSTLYELLDKCQFVATITGTVGWEAICKGKNVLVFGIPWYRDLTGVISFREGLTLERNYQLHALEHEVLEHQVGRLMSRTHHRRHHDLSSDDIQVAATTLIQTQNWWQTQ